MAASKGELEVVKYLIEEAKVYPNWTDNGGWSALMFSISENYSEVANYLLKEARVDPNVCGVEG